MRRACGSSLEEVLSVILVIIIIFRHSIPEQRSNGEDPSHAFA